jgi:hypothetical protein
MTDVFFVPHGSLVKIMDSLGRFWKRNGNDVRVDTGEDLILTVHNDPNVLKNEYGFVALAAEG